MQEKEQTVDREFVIITLIIEENQHRKFACIKKEKALSSGIIMRGKGTVKSATLNRLGIRSQKREIINILLEKEEAKEMLDYFTQELLLTKPGHGIAYLTPVTTADQIIGQDTRNTKEGTEGESMYKKLTVIVNRGMAEDVMDIARKAGVKGGTIMHGRGTDSECAAKIFGIEIEPEKELVIMLLPEDILDRTVNDLYRELQLEVPGNGILFVEPVLDVRGLFQKA